jgi:predicted glycosyl hydrolase (DUF1957 family)
MKQRFIITYESMHWCGGESHVVVWAEDAEDAVFRAEYFMEENMRELFSEEIAEEEMDDDECQHTVTSVEVLDETSEYWTYYNDPSQSSFYPEIGEPDEVD